MLHAPTVVFRFSLPLLAVLALSSWDSRAADKTVGEPQLSAAQARVVEEQIAGFKSAEGRQLASKWSNAKKVAEIMCQPLALETLRNRVPGTDRVFLGTEDQGTLTLSSNRLLSGRGELRLGNDWREFLFDCHLDPDTGKATAFRVTFEEL